jgi:hypothetical protein
MKYQKMSCENCKNEFVWSVEEQELYAKRGLVAPQHCAICRGMMSAKLQDKMRLKFENTRTPKS